MNTEYQEQPGNAETPRWPACAMFFGYLRNKNACGAPVCVAERHCGGSRGDVGLTCLSRTLSSKANHVAHDLISNRVSHTYIAWELRRYLYQLDELARRMQLEAMAWTYLTGFVVAAWLGVLWPFSYTLTHWPHRPSLLLLIPFLYFLLEPVRAGWLYYLSRRY